MSQMIENRPCSSLQHKGLEVRKMLAWAFGYPSTKNRWGRVETALEQRIKGLPYPAGQRLNLGFLKARRVFG